jgi:hypothetical protein
MRKTFNKNFDIEGNEFFRVCRTFIRSKIVPLGSFGSGPGIRCLLVLTVLHYFSAPIYYVFVRKEDAIRKVYLRLKRLAER